MFSLSVVHWVNKRCYKDANRESEAGGCRQFYKKSRSTRQVPEVICQKINLATSANLVKNVERNLLSHRKLGMRYSKDLKDNTIHCIHTIEDKSNKNEFSFHAL